MTYLEKRITTVVAIINTLEGLKRRYGKNYVYPSQMKIIALVKEYHKITVSRSTLYRVMKEMQAADMIHIINRLRKGSNGQLEFYTNAYYILQRVVGNVKRIFQSMMRAAQAYRVSESTQYSLTTKRDSCKSFEDEVEKVPLEWIKDFRLQLQSA